MSIKISYKDENKKVKKPSNYDGLLEVAYKAFGSSLPSAFKFFYIDVDNDQIAIDSEEDLEEFFSCMPMEKQKLTILKQSEHEGIKTNSLTGPFKSDQLPL